MSSLIPVNWRDSIERLRDEINQTFERWFSSRKEGLHDESDFWFPSLSTFSTFGGPVIDIDETDDKLTVTAELPGLDKDDFNVEVTEDRLIIKGEKKDSREKKGEGYYYSERSYGSFCRTIALPCEVELDKVKAKYKNGLLKITLPKSEQARTRKIQVKISE